MRRIKALYVSVYELLLKPVRGFRFARNLLSQGQHTIETTFTFGEVSFTLRTIIGFGDVINFIPHPGGYYHQQQWHDLSTDTAWQNCYREQLQIHFEKIKAFFNSFQKQASFWESGLTGAVSLTNLYPVYRALLLEEWILLLSPVISVAYLYFFGKVTAKGIVQLLWKIARKFFAAG
ncbi:hypothetical protein [Rhodoflexus sp.]